VNFNIAVSNINTAPDLLDLGTTIRVPRLVLRDAPVREVLALLARAAGLNLVFTDTSAGTTAAASSTISLDLANEPVQEVFNSVLLVSGLGANRRGNTIFVGARLPDTARNLVSRTLRLNQVPANSAGNFLATQGAEVQVLDEGLVNEVINPETQLVSRREQLPPTLRTVSIQGNDNSTAPLLLRGLKVSTDGRLNSITLVGEPRTVEIATAFITQLDARRRQVAVNVKVVDVTLSNEENFGASFSFGVNDTFFVQDNGAATLRFGPTSPAGTADIDSATGQLSNPPVVPNPFSDGDVFLDLNSAQTIPGGGGFTIINSPTGTDIQGPADSVFFPGVAGVSGNPISAGVTDFTLGTDTVITTTLDANGNPVTTIVPGTPGTITQELADLFQFPRQFLAQLEAQIISGNAKILTDPTLVVQEGSNAEVRLTQQVVTSIDTQVDPLSGVRTTTPEIGEAGLILAISVERIDDNGFVTLVVNPEVSAVGAIQTFDSGDDGGVNTISLLSVRALSSGTIRLRDGQTLILSGIIQESDTTTVSKVPILGDIPLLGALFRSTDTETLRSEVIVLLTPQIIDERSNFGYNYVPGPDAREQLRRRGLNVPGNP
ncbi:MAG: general secretion pathway protein GspD, partial [Chloroflexaceae bacterium]|nr:general secretion pathway protein GspD [Chloroflexaceae bacterium]